MTDYLSFLTLRMKNYPAMPSLDGQDYVILNSVSNVSKAIDVLHGYEHIHCLLDNDEAGRKAYWELEKEFAGRIRDFSNNYNGHKRPERLLVWQATESNCQSTATSHR